MNTYGDDEKHLAILDDMLTAPERFVEAIEGVGEIERSDLSPEEMIEEVRKQATMVAEVAKAVETAIARVESRFLGMSRGLVARQLLRHRASRLRVSSQPCQEAR